MSAPLPASNPPASAPQPGSHRTVLMTLVTSVAFMEFLDSTIIATALPTMAQSFGTSAVALSLGVSAYMLALGVFIPASGWVADRYGARRVFPLAIALFTLASALCGAADGLAEFVLCRILQGIAGAMMLPVGRLIVLRSLPPERLMAGLSALVWPALIAPVIGPPLGGFITLHAGWRWIFYINVPLGVIALVLACLVTPDTKDAHRRPFDWKGFALCGPATFALLCGFELVAEHPGVLSFTCLGAGLLLMVWAVRHLRRAPHPLLDLSAFRIPTFLVATRGGFLFRMGIGSAPFLLPLMFQVGFGYDAFYSGLLVLTVFVGNLSMKSVTTPILRRFGYRPVMVWNGLACALCLAACALLSPQTATVLTVFILLIGGMTRSMQFTVLGTIAYADIPKAQMSHANSLLTTVQQIAMAAGVALAAMGVRLGAWLNHASGWTDPGADYRVAFVVIGVVVLLGQIDAHRLPKGAADHFVSRA
jgi:EmrB/QacA subfamily drug resistance transporter